jgi:Phosphatidylethanolamine-binding protein
MPIPSHGPHSYVFQLFAVDHRPDLPDTLTLPDALRTMTGQVIGGARLEGTYEIRYRAPKQSLNRSRRPPHPTQKENPCHHSHRPCRRSARHRPAGRLYRGDRTLLQVWLCTARQ